MAGAYRPIDNDRLNVLAKAVYLSDTSPADQRINGNRIDYKQRSLILSLDATYDLIERCSVGGKVGHRSGEVTDGRNQDDFFESEATLYVARLDCRVVKEWDVMLEGRRLDLGPVPGRDGGLVGIFRPIGKNVRIGGGIAWGGVDDTYLSLDEDKGAGPFINLITTF